MTPEGLATKAILAYLNSMDRAWAVKVHAGAQQGRGVPDILGVVDGRSLALEVKRAKGGRLTAIQEWNLRRWRTAGAIAGVVTGVADVKALLRSAGNDEQEAR